MAHRGIKIFSIPEDFSNTTDALTSGQMQYRDIVMVKPTDYNFRMQIYQYLLGGPGGNIPYLEPLRPDDWRAIEESLSNSVGYYSQEDVEYTDNNLKFNITPVRVAHQEDYRNLLNFLRDISVNKFGDFLEGNFNLTRSKLQWKNNNYASELFLDKGDGQFRLNITPQSRFAISRINPNFSTLNQPLVLIGGTVTEVYTDTKITGSLEVTSNELIRGNLIVNGSSSLKGTTDIGEDGGNLTVHREAEIKGKVSLNTNANSTTTVYGDFIANKNVTLNNSSGTTRIKGNTSTDGNFSIGNNLTVNGQTVFNNNVYFNSGDIYVGSGSIYAPNGDLGIGRDASIGGSLVVNQNAQINRDLDVELNLSVGKSAVIQDNLTINTGDLEVSLGDLLVGGDTELKGELLVQEDIKTNGSLDVAKEVLFRDSVDIRRNLDVGGKLEVVDDTWLHKSLNVGHNITADNIIKSTWMDFRYSVHGNTIDSLNADMLDGHHWSEVEDSINNLATYLQEKLNEVRWKNINTNISENSSVTLSSIGIASNFNFLLIQHFLWGYSGNVAESFYYLDGVGYELGKQLGVGGQYASGSSSRTIQLIPLYNFNSYNAKDSLASTFKWAHTAGDWSREPFRAPKLKIIGAMKI